MYCVLCTRVESDRMQKCTVPTLPTLPRLNSSTLIPTPTTKPSTHSAIYKKAGEDR